MKYPVLSGNKTPSPGVGASAPLKELQKKFGFTPEHVVVRAKELVAKAR